MINLPSSILPFKVNAFLPLVSCAFSPINLYLPDLVKSFASNIKDVFRPGHADYTFFNKYGIRDYRGGGRSSARETAARVAAGAVAKKILAEIDAFMSKNWSNWE